MNNEKSFTVKEKNVLDLLSRDGNKFYIPVLQRDYDWTWKNNVSVMLDDFIEVTDNFTKPDATYLLGMIVTCTKEKDKEYMVIDGQQRLTTLSIICYLYYEYISKYINWNDVSESEDKIALQIRDMWPDFKKSYKNEKEEFVIQHEKDPSNDKITSYRFVEYFWDSEKVDESKIDRRHYKGVSDICRGVINFFDGLVYDRDDDGKSNVEEAQLLLNFGYFLMKNVTLVFCECTDETQAYTMFELINDRGKKLDKTDLIKNFLLKKINKNNEDIFKNNWENFKDNLIYEKHEKKADKVLPADHVIRSYLFASIGRKITISKLYEEFKKIAEDWDDDKIIKFVSDLSKMTRVLSDIKNPKITTENRYQDIIINVLDSKQAWPLIMLSESYGNDREEEKEKFLEFSFRLSYLGSVLGMQGNFIESPIGEALKKVDNGGIIKPLTEDQFEHFRTTIINFVNKYFDEKTVNNAIKEKTYTSDQMNKIITPIDVLICNHRYMTRNLDGVTVEHILPQSFENKKVDYKKYNFKDGKEMAKYINKIGNATLLHVPDNSSLGDKELKDKKEDYKNSDFMITKLLVSKIEESSSKAETKVTREKASKLLYIDEIAKSEIMTKDLIDKRNMKIYDAVKHLIYTNPRKN